MSRLIVESRHISSVTNVYSDIGKSHRLRGTESPYVQAEASLPLSFSHISLFFLISNWAPKFVKLEMYDL
jgi:hypothetical protein